MTLGLILSLLGIPLGLLIASITKEELAAGKKYFKPIKEFLFLIIIAVAMIFLFENKLNFLIILILSIVIYLTTKNKNRYLAFIPYFLFTLVYYLISDPNQRVVIASIVFIYGLLVGTQFYETIKKRS